MVSPISLIAVPVWVEGEIGQTTNLRKNGWYSSVRAQDLSGADWLATYGSDVPVVATFPLTLTKAGNYTLWVRANPINATLHAAVGASDNWLEVPISSDRHEIINIAARQLEFNTSIKTQSSVIDNNDDNTVVAVYLPGCIFPVDGLP